MKLQNYFQDPSSLHIGTEPLRAYYVPCREEAEANGADMLKASRAIILNGDDWKFKFYESYHQVPEGCTEKADPLSLQNGVRRLQCDAEHAHDPLPRDFRLHGDKGLRRERPLRAGGRRKIQHSRPVYHRRRQSG